MHYFRTFQQITCSDFNAFWRETVPYRQDGCGSGYFVNGTNYNKATPKSIEAAHKCESLRYPDKYRCLVYDCGVTGWEVSRKVRKIVRHHIKEVVERRTYKSRPKHILKGGTLKATHYYVFSYDARCYDRYEHGGLPGEHDEWSE